MLLFSGPGRDPSIRAFAFSFTPGSPPLALKLLDCLHRYPGALGKLFLFHPQHRSRTTDLLACSNFTPEVLTFFWR
jgi:hypothetical protein